MGFGFERVMKRKRVIAISAIRAISSEQRHSAAIVNVSATVFHASENGMYLSMILISFVCI